jgi:hypothetical protein
MEKTQKEEKMNQLSQHERCKLFLTNQYDSSTKLMSLLFIKNELERLTQNDEILSLKNTITSMIDHLIDH